MKTPNKSLRDVKNWTLARASVRAAILRFRLGGMKTPAAIKRLTPFLCVSNDRVHTLLYRHDRVIAMHREERHAIRMGAAAAELWLADYLEIWVEELRRSGRAAQAEEQALYESETGKCALLQNGLRTQVA